MLLKCLKQPRKQTREGPVTNISGLGNCSVEPVLRRSGSPMAKNSAEGQFGYDGLDNASCQCFRAELYGG